MSLIDLAGFVSDEISCESNRPLELDDKRHFWFVKDGTVDIFIEERLDGVVQAPPQHLLRAQAGRLLPSVVPNEGATQLRLIAKGLPDTKLIRIPVDLLQDIDRNQLAEQIDIWIEGISTTLSRYDASKTRVDLTLSPKNAQTIASGVVSTKRGVSWFCGMDEHSALYLGLTPPADGGSETGGIMAVTRDTWILLTNPQQLEIRGTDELAEQGLLLAALAHFHEVGLSLERINRELATVDAINLESDTRKSRATDEDLARRRLFDLYELTEARHGDGANRNLLSALARISERESVKLKVAQQWIEQNDAQTLAEILSASDVHARQVSFRHQPKWWLTTCGSLLAFRKDGSRPVALIENWRGRYVMFDPETRETSPVTDRIAESLEDEAWLILPTLTDDSVDLKHLSRLALRGIGAKSLHIAFIGFLSSLIALVPAAILGFLADQAMPAGETGVLPWVGMMLIFAALLAGLLRLLEGYALMRIEGHAAMRAEIAFWDRLMRLPTRFLQRFSIGDLALNGLAFQTFYDSLNATVSSGIIILMHLLLLISVAIVVDSNLGVTALLLGFAALLITVMFSVRQIRPIEKITASLRDWTGRMFESIDGISVLRVMRAEGSAFAVWAKSYRKQKNAELEHGEATGHAQASIVAMPIAGATVLIGVTAYEHPSASIGVFLFVFAFLMVFYSELARLSSALESFMAALISLNPIRQFLKEPAQTNSTANPIEHLTGDIHLDRVSFRYDADGPLILDNISIRTHPGEFVAIAGESGSGKSTLFKLMLGINDPISGTIYYDGCDLQQINKRQLYRKIGTIPQNVQLFPDDIWDNITADNIHADADQVWNAARLAKVDQDIYPMPMRMMTHVGAGGSVVSGGEAQRIMIARALLKNSRILILDEATNWLDNENQAAIMENIANLNVTRIVIAHRLSTLRQADRIYILDSGQIAEQGSYDDLMQAQGIFYRLVCQQLA